MESPDRDPHKYAQLTFVKEVKAIQQEKDSLVNKWRWSKWISMGKNLEPHTLHKINSKWITDLNVKHKTLKLLKENIGENLQDIRLDKEFLYMMPKTIHKREM